MLGLYLVDDLDVLLMLLWDLDRHASPTYIVAVVTDRVIDSLWWPGIVLDALTLHLMLEGCN